MIKKTLAAIALAIAFAFVLAFVALAYDVNDTEMECDPRHDGAAACEIRRKAAIQECKQRVQEGRSTGWTDDTLDFLRLTYRDPCTGLRIPFFGTRH